MAPDFYAYDVKALPTPVTRFVREVLGLSLFTWTVRTPEQRKIDLCCAGTYSAASTQKFFLWSSRLKNDNAQKEYYLPEVTLEAKADGVRSSITLVHQSGSAVVTLSLFGARPGRPGRAGPPGAIGS